MVDLSIIIVSYNTKDILNECLTSLYKNSGRYTSEVIVIDNASSDQSLAMVKKEFPDVLLIENKENFGFSKANNIGVQKSKGRYVLFLNSDTVVKKGVFDEMISFMDLYTDAGAATCMVVLPNGELDDASHRGFPTPWNAFCHFSGLSKIANTPFLSGYNLGWKGTHTIHEIDALAGAFMLVRRKAGQEVNWWDEEYFWYGEDIDFCYRLKQKEWKIYFVPTVSILHYKGVSGGIKDVSKHLSKATEETKTRVTQARFEAMRIFYKKHYIIKYPKIITWFVMRGIDIKLWFATAKQ